MKIVEQLQKEEVKVKTLALPVHKEVPEEVVKIKSEYLDKFGINNTTSKYINSQKQKMKNDEEKAKKEFANNEVLKVLIESFGMYKIVSYKVMDDIAREHNLFMSGLKRYDKAIPVENLEELNGFSEYLFNIDKNITEKLSTPTHANFIFEPSHKPLQVTGLDNMFFIMAPKSHFKMKKADGVVGREIGHIGDKPKFKYEFKVNKPEPIDPIIFLPIKIFDKVMCVVITAWDKVADDLRIRQMI